MVVKKVTYFDVDRIYIEENSHEYIYSLNMLLKT